MRRIATKFKPVSGFSHFVHIFLVVLLPVLIFVLVRINFAQLAVVLIVLSKWRMFAVRPRHWLANIRANAVDIILGVSTIIFMTQTSSQLVQLIWAVAYAMWLLLIKPGTSLFAVSAQALIAEVYGLIAIFTAWAAAPTAGLVVAVWVVCASCARHFFTSFDEAHTRFLSDFWGYFGAALTWVLGHWLIFYGPIAQPALILLVLSFGLMTLYYLDHTDRLSVTLRRQFIFIMLAVIIVVLVFSDWGDKAI